MVGDSGSDWASSAHSNVVRSGKQNLQVSLGSSDRMRGWSCSSQCLRAWRFLELSQHPTRPQTRHDLRCTQVSPDATHRSQTSDWGSATVSRRLKWKQGLVDMTAGPIQINPRVMLPR